jgi:hypothetical protein
VRAVNLIPADQRRGAGGGAEIDRTGVEEFECLVRSQRLYPADGDAFATEFLLQQPLLFQDHRNRIVGRPIDTDFLGRCGCMRQAGSDAGCDGGKEEITAG